MAIRLGWPFLGMLFLIICLLASAKLVMPTTDSNVTAYFNRTSFPENFTFGVASSSYQVARLNLYLASRLGFPIRSHQLLIMRLQLAIKIHTIQMVIRLNQAELIASWEHTPNSDAAVLLAARFCRLPSNLFSKLEPIKWFTCL